MNKSTTRRTRPAHHSNREIGSLPLSYFVVIAICGCVIAAGFLLAARQHFVSMDLGMKNSKLRKQLEDLETENRRLVLAREVAQSPIEITRTARGLGFVETADPALSLPVAGRPEPKNTNTSSTHAAVAVKSDVVSASVVARTSFQRPANGKSQAEPQKSAGEQKHISIRPEITAVAKLR